MSVACIPQNALCNRRKPEDICAKKHVFRLHLRTEQTTESTSVSPTRGLERVKSLPRGCTADLCLISEPLKHAVASFRRAASHLDQMILSSDLANET